MSNVKLAMFTERSITPEEHAEFEAAVRAQAPLDLTCLAYVCLDCGTIGACSDQEARDNFVRNFDFTCCDSDRTVGLTTLV